MHERRAVNLSVENAEPKESPLIERLGGPHAKHAPTKLPEHAQKTLARRPRRIVGRFLFRINDLYLGHIICESAIRNPSRIGRPRVRANILSISHNPPRPRAPATFHLR